MEVIITTQFGERHFEMEADDALSLIRMADSYSSLICPPKRPSGVEAAPTLQEDPEPEDEPYEPPMPAEPECHCCHTEQEPQEEEPEQEDGYHRPEGYSGFLFAKCEECGEVKAFCAKYPITYHRCSCGHKTELRDLRPLFVDCKCGQSFKYRTNIIDPITTIDCLACGAPVDLELNGHGTAYVTIGRKRRGGGTNTPYVFRPGQSLF